MKLKKKLVISICTCILIIFALCITKSHAFNPESFSGIYTGNGTSRFISWGNVIVGIIQTGAVATAVISLIVMGIKLMYASVEDKAEIKKHAIPYVIGSLLIFGATSLVTIVADAGKTLN